MTKNEGNSLIRQSTEVIDFVIFVPSVVEKNTQ